MTQPTSSRLMGMRAPRREAPSAPSSESVSLVNIPPEMLCLIASYVSPILPARDDVRVYLTDSDLSDSLQLVQYQDLNNLSLPCKTLKAIALPRLYHTIELKVPLRWNRLASLENLLATTPAGLRFTRGLHIVCQQAPIEDDCYGSLDNLNLTDDGEDEEYSMNDEREAFKHYVPGR